MLRVQDEEDGYDTKLMSKAAQQEPDEQILQKEVTLVAYADDEHKRSIDDFVTGLTGVDTSERENVSQRDVEIHIDLGKDYRAKLNVYDHEFTDEGLASFKRSLANSKLKEKIDIQDETSTSSRRTTSVSSAVSKWMGEVWSQLPLEVDDLQREENSGVWKDDRNVARIRVKKPQVEEMRVLAKESEREDDDLFETISERWSAQFQIIIEADNEEELDRRTEAIIPVLHKWLPKQNGIGKVRYKACTVTQQKEGECYNL